MWNKNSYIFRNTLVLRFYFFWRTIWKGLCHSKMKPRLCVIYSICSFFDSIANYSRWLKYTTLSYSKSFTGKCFPNLKGRTKLTLPPTNTCKHLPIATSTTLNHTPRCRSTLAHGVAILGVIGGATSYHTPLPLCRVGNELHFILG